jgi:hypothetical protein
MIYILYANVLLLSLLGLTKGFKMGLFCVKKMKTKLDLYISDKVKEKRIAKGLSLEAFGYAVNLSQSFVAHCENFRLDKKYNINHIHTIARFFECSLYDFIPPYPIE